MKTTQATETIQATQEMIDRIVADNTPVVNPEVINPTVLPLYATLDPELSHRFDKLEAYQKFHGYTLRDGEVRTTEKVDGVEIVTLYNVVIVGETVEKTGISKTNNQYFVSGEVFICPKDSYYSRVGTIVKGELTTEFDTRKLISPKVKQFLASQIQFMMEKQNEATKLKDERNLKASNHLKSLIKPRAN